MWKFISFVSFCLLVRAARSSPAAVNWHTDFVELLQEHVRIDSQNVDSFLRDVMTCKREPIAMNETTTAMNKNWTKCDSTGSLCIDLERQCVPVASLLRIYNRSQLDLTDVTTIEELSPFLLYQIITKNCQKEPEPTGKRTITVAETWGYGILSVTVISLSSMAGAVVIPIMNKKFFKKILMFFVSLAVGSLAGSGLVHLIPQAFQVAEGGDHTYIMRACVIMSGIYLFFVFERLLEMYLHNMDRRSGHGHSHGVPIDSSAGDGPDESHTVDLENFAYVKREPLEDLNTRAVMNRITQQASGDEDSEEETDKLAPVNGSTKVNGSVKSADAPKKSKGLATVAWMILIGDGLHNFIDGLSIGAAFTDGPMLGISVSLAILFEEVPHELGDLAIMLNAGVPLKRALLFNFLSACTCFIGLFIGIGVSNNTGFSVWIYAVAGGMFLYISLVVMVPEMNSALDELVNEQSGSATTKDGSSGGDGHGHVNNRRKLKLFFFQNVGIWIGFALMVITARYGGSIRLD